MAKKTPTRKRSSRQTPRGGMPAPLKARLRDVRNRLREVKADALLLTNPRDIRYLTGFIGDDSWALVSATGGKVRIISDFRFEEEIQRTAPHAAVHMRKGAITDALATVAERMKLEKIGLQVDHVTLAQRKALAKKLGAKRLLEVDDHLLDQRAVKDTGEVELIRKALDIQQTAFEHTVAAIEPGMSEEQIAGLLEYEMRVLGADGPSFPTIVAVGANASLPHAIPGRTKVKKNQMILIDWGARYRGYCSDLTRVVAVGKMPAKVKEIYQVVLEAQLAAIDAIRPGVSVKEVDKVARAVIGKAGFGDRFGHGLGHGIGLEVHERPVLSGRGEGVLEPGHVVTVEPGIYLPGVGGVRIEDDVLVTAAGHKVLSRLPKSAESAII